MIKPTIGRKVWYWPGAHNAGTFNVLDPEQALDATVVFVHNDKQVNLLVIDHLCHTHRLERITLVQEEDDRETEVINNAFRGIAEWIPYQVGQAKKA